MHELNIKIKETKHFIVDNEIQFEEKIKEIQSALQCGEEATVTKTIVGTVIILKIT